MKIRGKDVPISAKAINDLYDLPDFSHEHEELRDAENEGLNLIDVAETVGFSGTEFP